MVGYERALEVSRFLKDNGLDSTMKFFSLTRETVMRYANLAQSVRKMVGEENRNLVIGDLHEPFTLDG